MEKLIELPGCTPFHGKYIVDPAQDRSNEAYKWLIHHGERYKLADGILINTFNELEEEALKNLTKVELGKPLVYPVGPLVQTGSNEDKVEELECLTWLDNQPRRSVIFVSFGSDGTLWHNQIIELAYGLEISDQRFLWVLRSPNDAIKNATFFSVEGDMNNPLDFLPKGFLDRRKGWGLVIPMWAPQGKILSHESTAGFLTHCGWNSILESVINGVSLEQKINAILISEGLKVALKPNSDEKGLISREEIVTVVKGLMEGEEGENIRNRMKGLKDAAARALGEDGASTKAFLEIAQKWRSH